tara:strand:+ start:356 stop:739 length:384 start_codon:yes stop_codon:yes gene_type:complete
MNLKEYLYTLKVQELRDICKQSSIIGVSKFKKSALVETMSECDLKGIPEGLLLDTSKAAELPTIIEESLVSAAACCHGSDDPLCDKCEPIILHLPIKPDALKVHKDKWLKMFEKGKNILANGNAHTH